MLSKYIVPIQWVNGLKAVTWTLSEVEPHGKISKRNCFIEVRKRVYGGVCVQVQGYS